VVLIIAKPLKPVVLIIGICGFDYRKPFCAKMTQLKNDLSTGKYVVLIIGYVVLIIGRHLNMWF
jgi:hypothetical protein